MLDISVIAQATRLMIIVTSLTVLGVNRSDLVAFRFRRRIAPSELRLNSRHRALGLGVPHPWPMQKSL